MKFLDVIPGWVYALVIAVLLACLGAVAVETSALRLQLANAKTDAAEKTKAHALALAAETRRVLDLERVLNHQRTKQEKTDARHLATVQDLERRLRAASRDAGGPGLRDPWARPCPRGPALPAAGAADGGAGDPAEAGWVLSPELERLLLDRLSEADAINVAYASCRADALSLRETFNQELPATARASRGEPPPNPQSEIAP